MAIHPIPPTAMLLLTTLCWADSTEQLPVGAFSSEVPGNLIPSGWQQLNFEKIPRHTHYRLIKDNGITVVQARSTAAASGLIRNISIDLKRFPLIEWRWKIGKTIANSDVRHKKSDDYAARIYITFAYNPDKVGATKKAGYRAARLLFGDIPIAAINYIWERNTPIDTIVSNPYTRFSKMIVIENATQHVGQWVSEQRDLYRDYINAFGEEPPLVNGVAIMTDTDNTGDTAVAYYGDILFRKSLGENVNGK